MAKQTQQARNMKRLKDEQQVRQRAGVIFGTNDEHGAFHTFEEVFANSIDEAREGYGKYIKVVVRKPTEDEIKIGADPTVYVIEVHDNGRGLPMDWNADEEMYNWELALCTLYASGKYDSDQYSQSLGLNGLGLTSTQYASSFMNVWATYEGRTRYMHFRKGKPVGEMKILNPVREGSGTSIVFQPDPEVFPALKKVNFDASMFINNLNNQAMLHAGLEIEFDHVELTEPKVFCYKNGLPEFVDAVIGDNKMLPKAVEFFDDETGVDDTTPDLDPYKVDMRIAFNFARECSAVRIYHNGSYLFEGGKTVDGFELGITKAFTDYARNTGKLNRADKFSYKDIELMLVCVASTDAPGNRTWFKNQTKGAILNPFIGKAFMQFVYNKTRYWLENSKGAGEKIVAEAIVNKKAREEGEEVSKKVLRNLTKTVKFNSKPKGFRDCSSNLKSEREIYIVEGRSALTSVKLACNPKFQAVIPVRGKIINCLKEKITRVLNNDIIIDLYRVLGCGLEVKSKHLEDLPEFDINKLNWGKVIICTDADVDGMHIRCLLITMFYILSPSLLKAGKVFIAETPLYEMTYKKETRFAYTETERDMYMEEFRGMGAKDNQVKIQRSKGLGENSAEMMSLSTMNPATRRLIPVDYPETDEDVMMYFNALLGSDLETRRILIEEYFDLTETDLD